MDLHCEAILEQYKNNLESYQILKDIVLSKLKEFAKNLNLIVNSIEGRVKEEASLIGKLEHKGYKYSDIFSITDIVGCRIVTFYSDQVDKFSALIANTFKVDWDNSVDKRKNYGVDQFGYMSVHYICTVPKSLYDDPAHPEVNIIKFEIQIRSVLQHAWATIYHDTGYKNDVEVPSKYLRRLNRLAGLLELADEEFVEIRSELEEYKRAVKKIVKSGNLNQVELDGDSFGAYIESGVFDSLNSRIATINNMEIESVSIRRHLTLWKVGFKLKTLGEFDTLVKKYSDSAYKFCIYQFEGTDIDLISTATGPFALAMVCCYVHGGSLLDFKYALDLLFGERATNARLAKKYYDICEKMGLKVGESCE